MTDLGFQYYLPLSLNRIRLLLFFVALGSIVNTLLNIVLAKTDVFEIIVRTGFVPVVCISGIILVSQSFIRKSPFRTQFLIAFSIYLILISHMLLVLHGHQSLRDAYEQLCKFEPDASPMGMPGLATPAQSTSGTISWPSWLPQSPFDSNYSLSKFLNLTMQESPSGLTLNGEPLHDATVRYQAAVTAAMERYLVAEARYMTSVNAFVLFGTISSSSAGLRLVWFLVLAGGVVATVLATSIAFAIQRSYDGQLLRLDFLITAVMISGIWMCRPLESSVRRWFHIKKNYLD